MLEERNFASLKEVEEELKLLDLPKLIARMVAFAQYKLYDHDLTKAEDIVQDVFDKLLKHKRKWYEGKSLESTLFEAVKSLSNNNNKKELKKFKTLNVVVEIEDSKDCSDNFATDKVSIKELKEKAISILKNHNPPPDYLEELIFECWMEGMVKQQEVSKYLDEDIKEIRKGVKRLNRKLYSVQEYFKKLGYGK